MRRLLYIISLLYCFNASAQHCGCLPPFMFQFNKDGHHLLPQDHPSAKYNNDPKHWSWKNVSETNPEFDGFWEVKSEYMDSISDGKGGWIKAAFWTVERQKREQEERKNRKPE